MTIMLSQKQKKILWWLGLAIVTCVLFVNTVDGLLFWPLMWAMLYIIAFHKRVGLLEMAVLFVSVLGIAYALSYIAVQITTGVFISGTDTTAAGMSLAVMSVPAAIAFIVGSGMKVLHMILFKKSEPVVSLRNKHKSAASAAEKATYSKDTKISFVLVVLASVISIYVLLHFMRTL